MSGKQHGSHHSEREKQNAPLSASFLLSGLVLMTTCSSCTENISHNLATCPHCDADLRESSRYTVRSFVQLFYIFCGVHALLWVPVIILCVVNGVDHMRPMGEWPASFFFAVFLFGRGIYVASKLIFSNRSPKHALIPLFLTPIPLAILYGTAWYVEAVLEIQFAL